MVERSKRLEAAIEELTLAELVFHALHGGRKIGEVRAYSKMAIFWWYQATELFFRVERDIVPETLYKSIDKKRVG
jgi:hypothetical protein